MSNTANLNLPYIVAAQAQKHVTHNEAIRALDAIVQLSAVDRDLSSPPASPADGARYIVAAAASGAWAGQSGAIAAWQDGAWAFLQPREGWLCWIEDEDVALVWNGAEWTPLGAGASGLGGMSTTVAATPHGASTVLAMLEQEVVLSGATVISTIAIPDRAIVLGVTTRTTAAVTGATSYNCGIAGETSKYGGLLDVSLGATNSGVTGPTAFYAATPILITANGGSFTGGKVRLVIHYIACGSAAS